MVIRGYTKQERRKLRSGGCIMIPVVLVVPFFLLAAYIFQGSLLFKIGAVAIPIAVLIAFMFSMRKIFLDLRENKPEIVKGYITQKVTRANFSNTGNTSRTGAENHPSRTNYYLIMGESSYRVNANIYNQAIEDTYFHLIKAPRSGIIVGIERVEDPVFKR